MKVRERLEKMKEMGWTLDDLIELVVVLEKLDDVKPENIEDIVRFREDCHRIGNAAYTYSRIYKLMNEFMIYPNFKGYYYIIDAMLICFEDSKKLDSLSNGVYPAVARKNKTTVNGVERAIRYVIDKSWSRIPQNKKMEMFKGYESKPTNKAFLKIIYEKLSTEYLFNNK